MIFSAQMLQILFMFYKLSIYMQLFNQDPNWIKPAFQPSFVKDTVGQSAHSHFTSHSTSCTEYIYKFGIKHWQKEKKDLTAVLPGHHHDIFHLALGYRNGLVILLSFK